ncbi:MAG: hypothetical protein ACYDD1_16320 [Caulobacteraceae bacterium]
MNPELQRNLWLEATRRQLVITGLILSLIFFAVWLIDRGRDAHDFILAGAAVFVIAALFWGPREARSSVVNEVYNRTWDFQRLSALTPWTMTWGKLTGATCRPWMFAGVALALAFLQLASISSFAHALFWVLIGLGGAVFLQASGMAVGLIEIRKARAISRLPGLRSPGLGLLMLILLSVGISVWKRTHFSGFHGFNGDEATPLLMWWGVAYDRTAFAAASLIVFAGFAILWAWRLMRLELQMTNAPWAWLLFVVFAGLYAAGFESPTGATTFEVRLTFAAFAFAVCAYVSSFTEPADRVRVRRFGAAVPALDWARLWWALPSPLVPAVLAIISGAVVAMIQWRTGELGSAAFGLAVLAFFVRDLGFIAALRFSPRGKGGDFGVLIALVLLYVVGGLLGRVVGGSAGLAVFLPSLSVPALSLTAGLAEAVLLWVFAAWRITQNRRAPPKPLARPVPAQASAPSPAEPATAVPATPQPMWSFPQDPPAPPAPPQ